MSARLWLAAVLACAAAPVHAQTTAPTAGPANPPRPAAPAPASSSYAERRLREPPITLPPASRARMRACGLQWEAMKRSGKDGALGWRDFAMTCLALPDRP